MKIKNQLTLQRLIGKIDNDFNISESDWIPRVAAWTIDALSQLKCLPMEKKRRRLEVNDKVAIFPCEINAKELKLFDSCNNEIKQLDKSKECLCNNTDKIHLLRDDDDKRRFLTVDFDLNRVSPGNRNFVLDGNNIELNFDALYITVETYEVATYYDEYYDCECPYIYDNGLLLEALSWYCMFKYLSRGSKHPVYDLKSQNPTLNPFVQWNSIKQKAAISVKHDISKDLSGWNNFFYNSTFLPRDI